MSIQNWKPILVLFILAFPFRIHAQISGCTDLNASNFNPSATQNDGSCSYSYTPWTPAVHLNNLSGSLNENSGLIFWKGHFWTHTDSGGNAEIYKLDSLSGSIVQTLTLSNATNMDWEDIAQDQDYIYVGDIGNNSGSRTNLKIYKIAKSQIPDQGNTSLQAEVIQYNYSDQSTFTPAYNNTPFDCEALAAGPEGLWLFTKDWVNSRSKCYILSKNPGTHTAMLKDSFAADGLITGADYNMDKNQIVLLGYSNNPPTYYPPFVWLLFDFQTGQPFTGHKRKIKFPTFLGVQTEGITFSTSEHIFVSSEQSSFIPARIFTFSYDRWTDDVLYAWFYSDKDSISSSEHINFTDLSNGNPNGWFWEFEGGTPATSRSQNPTGISYMYPGNYDVTLTVSDADQIISHTRHNLIYVEQSQYLTHTLNIPMGWSGLSSFVQPSDSLLNNIFDTLAENLLFFGNLDDQFYPDKLKDLQYWHSGIGYLIKLGQAQNLEIRGTPQNKHLEYEQGWFILPILSNDTLSADEVAELSGYKITLIKEIAGTNVFWPEMSINSLQYLIPGKAYLCRSVDAGSIDF